MNAFHYTDGRNGKNSFAQTTCERDLELECVHCDLSNSAHMHAL